jgi:hypothetical protein
MSKGLQRELAALVSADMVGKTYSAFPGWDV